MLYKIAYYTNIHLPCGQPHSNETEIRALIGLLLLFGVTKKNHVDNNEIWQDKSVHHMDHATSTMRRDRFKLLCSKISFDDNDTKMTN